MTWEDVIAKFKDCASFAALPMTHGNINLLADKIQRLEDVQEISELVKLVS